jgi:hypothetical protein
MTSNCGETRYAVAGTNHAGGAAPRSRSSAKVSDARRWASIATCGPVTLIDWLEDVVGTRRRGAGEAKGVDCAVAGGGSAPGGKTPEGGGRSGGVASGELEEGSEGRCPRGERLGGDPGAVPEAAPEGVDPCSGSRAGGCALLPADDAADADADADAEAESPVENVWDTADCIDSRTRACPTA